MPPARTKNSTAAPSPKSLPLRSGSPKPGAAKRATTPCSSASAPSSNLSELLAQYAPLTREEEQTASPEKLFYHNLRFALTMLRRVPAADQESSKASAILGLWEAAQNYDPIKGAGLRFISYARFTILRRMSLNWAEEFSGLVVPVKARQALRRLQAGEALSPVKTRHLCDLVAVSLDCDHPETGESFHGLVDSGTPDPQQARVAVETPEMLRRWFDLALDKREAFVLTRLFGLDGEEPENLRQLGKKLGVTHQRVEQIEKKALRKLREFKRLKKAW